MIRQPRRGRLSELDAPHTQRTAGQHHLTPRHPPKARLVLSPPASWRELLISSPGQTSPHPLLSPFPAGVHRAHLWPLFMDPPSGARGQVGIRPRKSGFHPSHRAAHPRLNPTLRGAMNLPPSTVQPNLTLSGCHGAISGAPQPVGQDLRRMAASPHPASFTGGLTSAHTHRPGTSPNTPGSWTPAPPAPFTKQRFTAAR